MVRKQIISGQRHSSRPSSPERARTAQRAGAFDQGRDEQKHAYANADMLPITCLTLWSSEYAAQKGRAPAYFTDLQLDDDYFAEMPLSSGSGCDSPLNSSTSGSIAVSQDDALSECETMSHVSCASPTRSFSSRSCAPERPPAMSPSRRGLSKLSSAVFDPSGMKRAHSNTAIGASSQHALHSRSLSPERPTAMTPSRRRLSKLSSEIFDPTNMQSVHINVSAIHADTPSELPIKVDYQPDPHSCISASAASSIEQAVPSFSCRAPASTQHSKPTTSFTDKLAPLRAARASALASTPEHASASNIRLPGNARPGSPVRFITLKTTTFSSLRSTPSPAAVRCDVGVLSFD